MAHSLPGIDGDENVAEMDIEWLAKTRDKIGVQYSGHQDSQLVGLVVEMTKQARFPTIRGRRKGGCSSAYVHLQA